MSASPYFIHLYPSKTADNPVAQAVLTVKEGPRNLYLTLSVAQGIFVKICNMDSLFTVL